MLQHMVATVWAVLIDEHRRDMLELLRGRPRAVNELVDELQLSQPTVSKHLRVLREAGFVRVSTDAQRRIYAIDAGRLVELDAWLRPYRALWNESLDSLGRRLDATAPHRSAARRAGRRARKET
jgi:DNA-binding transcriptional ArsR family regulator